MSRTRNDRGLRFTASQRVAIADTVRSVWSDDRGAAARGLPEFSASFL
jgi:hypothetical protein